MSIQFRQSARARKFSAGIGRQKTTARLIAEHNDQFGFSQGRVYLTKVGGIDCAGFVQTI